MGSQAQAQEYFNAAKHHLMELGRSNDWLNVPNVIDPLGASQWGPYGGRGTSRGGMGGYTVKSGVAPSDHDVQAFIDSMGGNPYVESSGGGGGTTTLDKSLVETPFQKAKRLKELEANSPEGMFKKLSADYQKKVDEANKANLARYDEGKGELSGLRTRNQDRVSNWGKVQEQLNAEAAKQTLGGIAADLASRGLSSSTILPSFKERSARDLGLLQQDVSERRDARASQYDSQDTNNLVGFIERRNDVAPDTGPLFQLSQQLGQLKAFQEAQAARQAQPSPYQQQPQQAPQIPYYPANGYMGYGGGQQGAIFLNGNPYEAAQGWFGGGGNYQPQQGGYDAGGYGGQPQQQPMDPALAARIQKRQLADHGRYDNIGSPLMGGNFRGAQAQVKKFIPPSLGPAAARLETNGVEYSPDSNVYGYGNTLRKAYGHTPYPPYIPASYQ